MYASESNNTYSVPYMYSDASSERCIIPVYTEKMLFCPIHYVDAKYDSSSYDGDNKVFHFLICL